LFTLCHQTTILSEKLDNRLIYWGVYRFNRLSQHQSCRISQTGFLPVFGASQIARPLAEYVDSKKPVRSRGQRPTAVGGSLSMPRFDPTGLYHGMATGCSVGATVTGRAGPDHLPGAGRDVQPPSSDGWL